MAPIFVNLSTYIPVSGLLLVAAITPGPNNLIVMERATKGGLRAALRPVVGVGSARSSLHGRWLSKGDPG
jgi:threonine/homoserine/homoserine lactone efflux protein